jgi:aspartate/methionine/tyrosine aminotransferase
MVHWASTSSEAYFGCNNAYRLQYDSLLIPSKQMAHVFNTAVNSPLQEATAVGFEQALSNGFFPQQIEEYEARRTVLAKAFDDLGLPYTMPDGTYFILLNNDRIKIPDDFVISDLVRCMKKENHFNAHNTDEPLGKR